MRSRAIRAWQNSKSYVLSIAALAGSFISVSQAQPIAVPMSPESFVIDASRTGPSEQAIQFGDFLGRRAVYLPSGFLNVKKANFRDGTVEFDVASKPHSLFIGIGLESNQKRIWK